MDRAGKFATMAGRRRTALKPLAADWFCRQDTLGMAQALLGQLLVHETPDGTLSGMIVETEAYLGPTDRAAHSFGNRRTRRTEPMFGLPGHAYLYQIYGMHVCFDVVSGPEGQPQAVLVRALAPVDGLAVMRRLRGLSPSQPDWQTANGPGKLTRALAITMADNRHPLWEPPLYIAPYQSPWPAHQIARGPRRNIRYAQEAQYYPWRFWIRGQRAVSPPHRPADETQA